MEATRTVLADSDLPMSFWEEAIKYTAFVNNRIINRKHRKSPLELMFGTKPDYDDIYPFGTKVHVYIPTQIFKLDFKSKEGIYVGHDELSKGYRIADPKAYAMVISRDVKFRKCDVSNLEPNFIEFKFKINLKEENKIMGEEEVSSEEEISSEDSSDDEFFDTAEPVVRRSKSNRYILS